MCAKLTSDVKCVDNGKENACFGGSEGSTATERQRLHCEVKKNLPASLRLCIGNHGGIALPLTGVTGVQHETLSEVVAFLLDAFSVAQLVEVVLRVYVIVCDCV